jgi:hypothetical protein
VIIVVDIGSSQHRRYVVQKIDSVFIDQGGVSLLRIGERGEAVACAPLPAALYVYLQLTALCHELIRQPPGRSVLPKTSNRDKSSCGEGYLKTNPQERTHAQLRLQLVPLFHPHWLPPRGDRRNQALPRRSSALYVR